MSDIVNGLLRRNHHVLMAHRSPERRNYPGTWSFPGGHVEVGETLEDALVRELSEEIGVQARSWSFLRRFLDFPFGPDRPVAFHFFVVTEWLDEPQNIGDEHTQIRWVNLQDAAKVKNLTFPVYDELFEALATG